MPKCTYCFDHKILFIPENYEATDVEYCPVCNSLPESDFNQIAYPAVSVTNDSEIEIMKEFIELTKEYFLTNRVMEIKK